MRQSRLPTAADDLIHSFYLFDLPVLTPAWRLDFSRKFPPNPQSHKANRHGRQEQLGQGMSRRWLRRARTRKVPYPMRKISPESCNHYNSPSKYQSVTVHRTHTRRGALKWPTYGEEIDTAPNARQSQRTNFQRPSHKNSGAATNKKSKALKAVDQTTAGRRTPS